MPKIQYISNRFHKSSLRTITIADEICQAYAAQGLTLTLRQLYYRFVAAGHIPNNMREYSKLGETLNTARLAGLLDWNHIEDRTRNLRSLPNWNDPSEGIDALASQYRRDIWEDQPTYVEAWVEKDALIGVLEQVANEERIPFFSCRGYTSQSEIWRAANRFMRASDRGQETVIIHLGDHDPSGIDMTRDIQDRLDLFCSHHGRKSPTVLRIALNMDQIDQYAPPPNPAKLTDSRATSYIEEFGYDSWELDALEPAVLLNLVRETVDRYRDVEAWDATIEREETEREVLTQLSERWGEVPGLLALSDELIVAECDHPTVWSGDLTPFNAKHFVGHLITNKRPNGHAVPARNRPEYREIARTRENDPTHAPDYSV